MSPLRVTVKVNACVPLFCSTCETSLMESVGGVGGGAVGPLTSMSAANSEVSPRGAFAIVVAVAVTVHTPAALSVITIFQITLLR